MRGFLHRMCAVQFECARAIFLLNVRASFSLECASNKHAFSVLCSVCVVCVAFHVCGVSNCTCTRICIARACVCACVCFHMYALSRDSDGLDHVAALCVCVLILIWCVRSEDPDALDHCVAAWCAY